MTTKSFSFAAFVEFGNKDLNETPEFRDAVHKDMKKMLKGVIPDNEMDVINDIDVDLSNTLGCMPKLISDFMDKESRAFNIPAPNANTTPATIKIVDKEAETKTGTIQFGANAGKPYTTEIAAHSEFTVKNNRDEFKK